jgi:hypothetical protein
MKINVPLSMYAARLLVASALLLFPLATLAQTEKVLYSFESGSDGSHPTSNLIPDGSGGFYGITHSGGGPNCGGYGCGTFFHLSSPTQPGGAWSNAVLYSFQGVPDVSQPDFELVRDSTGNFYGTAESGGQANWGAIFELSPPAQQGGDWTETILYNFTDGVDGGNPQGGVVFGIGGALYGTTVYGGPSKTDNCYPYGCGVVFQLLPPASAGASWTETSIYNFPSQPINYGNDMKLAAGKNGVLLGTTQLLGSNSLGSVFALVPPASEGGPWIERDIYSFTGGSDGLFPLAGVTIDNAGNLFGTTNGSENVLGTVFILVPPAPGGKNWTFRLLYTFLGSPNDGAHPQTTLALDDDHNLYGTTFGGGVDNNGNCFALVGCGVIFELSPTASGWTETILHKFHGGNDGSTSEAPVTVLGEVVYGTTWFDGPFGDNGTVFAIHH